MALTPESIMTGGKYDGFKMVDVPYYHLKYIFKNKKCNWKVRQYIEKYHESITKKEN